MKLTLMIWSNGCYFVGDFNYSSTFISMLGGAGMKKLLPLKTQGEVAIKEAPETQTRKSFFHVK